MNSEEVKAILESALPDCDVTVEVDGSHFQVTVVGDVFEGARPVRRQQMVYGALSGAIADGTIHAVHMQTYTRAEWQAR